MPPHRKPRRFLPTAAFYDKAGAIGSPLPSPTGSSFGDDAYTLTGYGELSSESAFMLPPSPTQTIKYRYRAYRPKLARLRKQRSSASKSSLKTKSSAYHPSDYASILNAYLSGTPGQSPKRDFRALLQKCRETAAEARQGERGGDAYATPSRKAYTDNRLGLGGVSTRRGGVGSLLANR